MQELYRIIADHTRRVFWQAMIYKYDSRSFVCFKGNDLLYMEFGSEQQNHICVLEFGKEGPLYIFTKRYYEMNIKRLIQRSASDLKSTLYNLHVRKEGFTNRFTHNGDWETRTKEQLDRILNKKL